MLDIGWTELLLIGIIALIVVGPKDLPGMFRNLGRMVGRARGMAHEFKRAMESAADESGVKDVARDLKETASGKNMGLDEFRDIAKSPKSWAKDQALGRSGDKRKKDEADDSGEAAADDADAADVAEKGRGSKPGPGPATRALKEKRAAEALERRDGATGSTKAPADTETRAKTSAAKGKAASTKAEGTGKASASAAGKSASSTTRKTASPAKSPSKAGSSSKSASPARTVSGKSSGGERAADAGKTASAGKKATTSGKAAAGARKPSKRSEPSGDA